MQSRSQSSSANSDLSNSSNRPGDEAGGYVELRCRTVLGDEL